MFGRIFTTSPERRICGCFPFSRNLSSSGNTRQPFFLQQRIQFFPDCVCFTGADVPGYDIKQLAQLSGCYAQVQADAHVGAGHRFHTAYGGKDGNGGQFAFIISQNVPFKTLTLAMALEENVVDLNTGFYCSGSVKIEGETINCSKRAPGHGQQNLTQAFANSCNPAFINIGLRIGNDKFYQYMLDFGLTEKTGVDTTGEASGFVNSEIKYSTLALACYAFGQNFNVTPIALLAAQCACVNGGYLYTPYLVKEITDQNGNVVSKHDSTPIRQVVSEETSALVRDIMEYEVTSGTGKNGQVAGYRIGGKTGTADKVGGGVIVSFVCFAPADDPQVMMLLTLDEPSKWTGTYVSGGNMVAPVASSVMGEILPYLGIEPSYTAEELVGADKTVPNVVGLSKDAAAERLSANGFSFRTVGSGDTVTDQTPAGGAIVPNSAEIILYLGAEKSTDKCIVPNVVGDSAATANQKIVNAGLIMGVSGATNASSSTVRAISQSIAAGTEVEAGTVVRVQFSDSSVRD